MQYGPGKRLPEDAIDSPFKSSKTLQDNQVSPLRFGPCRIITKYVVYCLKIQCSPHCAALHNVGIVSVRILRMEPNFKNEIEKIIGQIECPKGFSCYKSGFENLCKAEDVGLSVHLVCRDVAPSSCFFSWNLSPTFYCTCPVRVRIAKELEK